MTDPSRRFSLPSVLACSLCAFAGGGLLGIWAEHQVGGDREASALVVEAAPAPVHRQELASRKKAAVRLPVSLDIPAIDVSTPLVQLGLEPDRTVEVPADADLAGWFRRGPEPGRRGSAVILGHVDSAQGPAVFARLEELQRGDSVEVSRADGSVVSFVVKKSVTYLNADFPAQGVYASPRGRRLNLVTCDGAYDADRGGYQANLVVYTQRARN